MPVMYPEKFHLGASKFKDYEELLTDFMRRAPRDFEPTASKYWFHAAWEGGSMNDVLRRWLTKLGFTYLTHENAVWFLYPDAEGVWTRTAMCVNQDDSVDYFRQEFDFDPEAMNSLLDSDVKAENYHYNQVELFYGWQETECGTFHSFIAMDPEYIINDDMGEELAEQLDTNTDDERFNWSSMRVNLPETLVRRIKQAGVQEYLEIKSAETKNSK